MFISYRNTIQFTPTQIEAIRAGMQPGLTMVRTFYFVLFFLHESKKHTQSKENLQDINDKENGSISA